LRQSTKIHTQYQGLQLLFYRAALPLSHKTLTFASGIIRRHRKAIGSRWRKLNPRQQALMVLAYLRKGDTFADLIASGSYDHHLRRMRRRYRARRDALVNALNRWLPAARVRGVSAGLHLLIELPPGCAEADVAAAAAARGIAVGQVAPMRAAPGGPPALVLGYARLPEQHLTDAARLLAHAVHAAQARATSQARVP